MWALESKGESGPREKVGYLGGSSLSCGPFSLVFVLQGSPHWPHPSGYPLPTTTAGCPSLSHTWERNLLFLCFPLNLHWSERGIRKNSPGGSGESYGDPLRRSPSRGPTVQECGEGTPPFPHPTMPLLETTSPTWQRFPLPGLSRGRVWRIKSTAVESDRPGFKALRAVRFWSLRFPICNTGPRR